MTVASRSADKVAAVATEVGAIGRPLDTGDEDAVCAVFAEAGVLDHLVVTGSSVRTGPRQETSRADGEFTFRSTFFGPYRCAR